MTTSAFPTSDDDIRALRVKVLRALGAAAYPTKARTRRLAVKIRESLAELRGLVKTEKQEAKAALAEAEERARLKAEVDELERQLAEKKAKLKPSGARASTTSTGNAAEIRAWAAEHSVACPGFGRVPRDVVEAYQVATGKGA